MAPLVFQGVTLSTSGKAVAWSIGRLEQGYMRKNHQCTLLFEDTMDTKILGGSHTFDFEKMTTLGVFKMLDLMT